MDNKDKKEIRNIKEQIEDIIARLQVIQSFEEMKYDSLSGNAQMSERGMKLEKNQDIINDICDELNDVISEIEELI